MSSTVTPALSTRVRRRLRDAVAPAAPALIDLDGMPHNDQVLFAQVALTTMGLTRGFGWSDNAWLTGAGGRGFTFIYRLIDSLGVTAEDKGGAMVAGNVQDWMAQRPKDAPPAFVFVCDRPKR